MSETTVRVDIRQAVLSENARLRDAGELLFLALDNPPPVRSLLRIVEGDEHKAFEVARVIEVLDDSEPARGCYGRYVDLERLAAQTRVGSEHLEPGVATSGVPAPVVIMSTGDMMLGEAGEEGEMAASEGEAEVAASEGATEGSGDASDLGDDSP